MSTKNSDSIGNRNRDLPTWSVVPEPTSSARAPDSSPRTGRACTKTTYTFSHATISESLISIPRDSSTLWFSAKIPHTARDCEPEKFRWRGEGGGRVQRSIRYVCCWIWWMIKQWSMAGTFWPKCFVVYSTFDRAADQWRWGGGRRSRYKLLGHGDTEGGPEPDYVVYDFVPYGSIITCGLHKINPFRTISEKIRSRSALVLGGLKKNFHQGPNPLLAALLQILTEKTIPF
jgi:hypothetical protein